MNVREPWLDLNGIIDLIQECPWTSWRIIRQPGNITLRHPLILFSFLCSYLIIFSSDKSALTLLFSYLGLGTTLGTFKGTDKIIF